MLAGRFPGIIVKTSGLVACGRADAIHIDGTGPRVAKIGIWHEKMVFLAAVIVARGFTVQAR